MVKIFLLPPSFFFSFFFIHIFTRLLSREIISRDQRMQQNCYSIFEAIQFKVSGHRFAFFPSFFCFFPYSASFPSGPELTLVL